MCCPSLRTRNRKSSGTADDSSPTVVVHSSKCKSYMSSIFVVFVATKLLQVAEGSVSKPASILFTATKLGHAHPLPC